jgi:hypothetical protein
MKVHVTHTIDPNLIARIDADVARRNKEVTSGPKWTRSSWIERVAERALAANGAEPGGATAKLPTKAPAKKPPAAKRARKAST